MNGYSPLVCKRALVARSQLPNLILPRDHSRTHIGWTVGAQPKHNANIHLSCIRKALPRYGLEPEADRLKPVSRRLLDRVFPDSDFDSSPADPAALGHPGIRSVHPFCSVAALSIMNRLWTALKLPNLKAGNCSQYVLR